ncbi:MAG: FAD-dependent oxidoreductase [Candidatus Omnitrophota bacterium]|jgi:hypothetical protein|nr:MAG: FAD-dependent oxidoreductase [Candidatus Omnitrophota bacterium]
MFRKLLIPILCVLTLAFCVWSDRSHAKQLLSFPTIWLEAECFETVGEWVNDSQFVDVMGSPYLLANGVDAPVADAVTHAEIPTDGGYRLWVRCKDWLPEHSPGHFQVLVNGQPSPVTFGDSTDDQWKWIDGQSFALKAGTIEIRLHDLTGWWGRCDAVVLTADENFRPADDPRFLESQRRHYFEPYRHIDEMQEYDVVVIGGGLAGSAAAVAAARHGSSVVLIQDRPVLGGNASAEIDVAPGGDQSNQPLDPTETGIIEEFYGKPDRGFDHDWSGEIERVVRGESNLDLRLNTRAINVVMKDEKTIAAVVAIDVKSGKRMLFPGKIFIDCTGDGWIGFYAGAEFRKGREAQSEFVESLAPAKADAKTMGNTLMVAQFEEDAPSTFENPKWAYEWKSKEDFEQAGFHFSLDQTMFPAENWQDPYVNRFTYGAGFYGRQYVSKPLEDVAQGSAERPMPIPLPHYKQFEKGKGYYPRSQHGGFFEWWVEFGGIMDTIYDAETIRDELFRINLGLWNYVKNYAPDHKEKNKNRRLTYINYVAGKRESRRMQGDYLLTQWDYADRVIHGDNVAYGGWGIDVHHPNGFWTAGPMYYSAYRNLKISIPYRCLYSRSIDNLFMAGRNASVSHVALGGVRVMRTTCVMGQAVGVAAALCAEKNMQPRAAGKEYIEVIQQRLLKDGAFVMGQKNNDPNDLALQATVAATSIKTIPDPKLTYSDIPLIHDLNTQRAVMFKAPQNKLERIALYLRSSNNSPTPISLTLRKAKAFRDFTTDVNLAVVESSVPANSEGWVSFKFDQNVDAGQYYYVFLSPKTGLQWDLFTVTKKDACRAYGGPNWTVRDECYTYSFNPEQEPRQNQIPQITLPAENVIDGFNRAVDGVPHSWGPDTNATLPQSLVLNWNESKTFNTVHLTFQNIPLACPKYRIEIFDGNNWKAIVNESANALRRRIHRFAAINANRLRLTLESPSLGNAKDSPQLCEIRVYNER